MLLLSTFLLLAARNAECLLSSGTKGGRPPPRHLQLEALLGKQRRESSGAHPWTKAGWPQLLLTVFPGKLPTGRGAVARIMQGCILRAGICGYAGACQKEQWGASCAGGMEEMPEIPAEGF